jgi:trans-aconitate methyltransferase
MKQQNEWTADSYERNARFVSDLATPVVSLLSAQPGERVLDLGCGDGVLAAQLMQFGCHVIGVDASDDLVRAACDRGVDARLIDARELCFDEQFDAVLTNAVLHWIPEAALVAGNVYRSLKPGGRFVGEFGGHENIAAIMTALVAVLRSHGVNVNGKLGWYYPTANEYKIVLDEAGFKVDSIELIPRPTPLPTGMQGWVQTFRGKYLRDHLGDKAEDAIAQMIELLRPALCDTEGNWTADYVRLRFKATRAGQ